MPDFERDPIRESITVDAPLERCWALSTRVELVQKTLGMKLAGGVTTGFIEGGSRVHWRGWKFGLPAEHHTLITAFRPPHAGVFGDPATEFDGQQVAWFEDSQEHGRFATFHHMHIFREREHDVLLEDHIHFSLPFGPVGRAVARWVMAPHIRKLARLRFGILKQLAEGEGWRAWVEGRATSGPHPGI